MMLKQTNVQKPCGATTASPTSPASAAPCAGSEPTSLERTRFFQRQLVTPDDLTQDQTYFRDKERRHNRMLHGWGVVCGARCQWKEKDCNVIIEAGYILGPYGDEIVISSQQIINICKQNLDGNTFSGCGDLTDPWCQDVRTTRKPGQTYYLAIRYDECQGRPVGVTSAECGCGDGGCEYTRIRDSYVIQVLDQLPDSYANFTPPNYLNAFRCGPAKRSQPCPPCPTDPWVILADFTLNADGTLANLRCDTFRRYVVSFADIFFTCTEYKQIGREAGYGSMMQPVGMTDLRMMNSGVAPSQAVAVKLSDGSWSTMPVYFTVKAGQTLGDLLATEGDRQYYDSSSGETYTLRELYALSGAKPDMKLASVQDAMLPLEGIKLDVPGLRVVQGSLATMLNTSGADTLNATALGDPAAAPALKAHTLQGVDPASKVASAIARQTIAEVAAVPQEDFVKKVAAGLTGKQAAAEKAQAREVWIKANRVVSLANAWKK